MLLVAAPGQGAQAPGFLAPWLELPGVSDRLAAWSDLVGCDLIRYGTTAGADEITDTAIAQVKTVAGPVFLSYIGMTLFLVAKLTGKQIKLPRLNIWMPYIWTLGIMIFSTGLFIGGAGGEPRRTNMGLTYTNPQSPLYHADWQAAKHLGTIGGTIMTIAPRAGRWVSAHSTVPVMRPVGATTTGCSL